MSRKAYNSMARGKVQMRRIENPIHRQVTFCKRRNGLLKKAKELSVLCDADVGIIIFSPHGKLFELATSGTMEGLVERYRNACGEAKIAGENQSQESKQEVMMPKQEINLLQKGFRYMFGTRTGTNPMSLDELNALERSLEVWMYNIRSVKMQMMLQEIQSLKNKEGILKATNEILQEQIVEQNGLFDVAQIAAHQNGYFSEGPAHLTSDNYYPLTNTLSVHDDNFIFRGSGMGFTY